MPAETSFLRESILPSHRLSFVLSLAIRQVTGQLLCYPAAQYLYTYIMSKASNKTQAKPSESKNSNYSPAEFWLKKNWWLSDSIKQRAGNFLITSAYYAGGGGQFAAKLPFILILHKLDQQTQNHPLRADDRLPPGIAIKPNQFDDFKRAFLRFMMMHESKSQEEINLMYGQRASDFKNDLEIQGITQWSKQGLQRIPGLVAYSQLKALEIVNAFKQIPLQKGIDVADDIIAADFADNAEPVFSKIADIKKNFYIKQLRSELQQLEESEESEQETEDEGEDEEDGEEEEEGEEEEAEEEEGDAGDETKTEAGSDFEDNENGNKKRKKESVSDSEIEVVAVEASQATSKKAASQGDEQKKMTKKPAKKTKSDVDGTKSYASAAASQVAATAPATMVSTRNANQVIINDCIVAAHKMKKTSGGLPATASQKQGNKK